MEDELSHKPKNFLQNINIILDENEDINHFEMAFCHVFFNKTSTA